MAKISMKSNARESMNVTRKAMQKSEARKSDNKFQKILALMQDMTTEEREEASSLIEVRGCKNFQDVFGIFDVMADNEYKSEKSMKSKVKKDDDFPEYHGDVGEIINNGKLVYAGEYEPALGETYWMYSYNGRLFQVYMGGNKTGSEPNINGITYCCEVLAPNILDMYLNKAKKSVKRNSDVLLKKGWVRKEEDKEPDSEDVEEEESEEDKKTEEESTEEESEETESDDDVEIDVDVEKAKKTAQKDPFKAMRGLLKSKGFVLKAEEDDDDGPDSEEVEEEALGEDKVVEIPETPEPTEDVQQTETGIPEEPPEAESEDNETPTEEDGNDMESLLPETITNLKLDLGNDVNEDLDEMIDKKRSQYGDDISLSAVGGMQPFKNNYRTTQMGEGKMNVMSQLKVNAKR